MPISSAGRHIKAANACTGNGSKISKRSNWSSRNLSSAEDNRPVDNESFGSFQTKRPAQLATKYKSNKQSTSRNNPINSSSSSETQIKNLILEQESDVASVSNRQTIDKTIDLAMNHGTQQPNSMNIGGHLILTGGHNKQQPNSIASIMNLETNRNNEGVSGQNNAGSKSYLARGAIQATSKASNLTQSRNSLDPTTTNNSTAHLHSLGSLSGNQRSRTHPLSISRNVNLKYIKTMIILLMAVDLFITVFVHQFSIQDQISIWHTPYKLRFSLLNLVLSAIWFITLMGAILFDILFILIIGCIVDVASLTLLFGLSVVHFSQRIDYNNVNLTSLLLLLFGIVVLHVYMIVMTTLTIYLMLAVKRRRAHSSR